MAFDSSLLVEEESGFDPALLEEEPQPLSKLEQAEADLAELGGVLQAHRKEQGPAIGPSERSPLQRLRTSTVGRAIAGPTREERAAMVAQQPSVTDIAKTMLKFTTAPPQFTEPIAEATEPLISQLPPVAAGITRGVRDVAVGALGSLPAGMIMPARLVAAPFAADYASTIPEQFQAIRESETPEQAAQALTTTGLGGALTAAGTIHAFQPPRIRPGAISINQAVAPEVYNIEPAVRVGPGRSISLGVPEVRASPEIARLPPSGLSMAREPAPASPVPPADVLANEGMVKALEDEAIAREIRSRVPPVEGPEAPIGLGVPEIRVSPEIARLPPSGLSMADQPAPVVPREVDLTPPALKMKSEVIPELRPTAKEVAQEMPAQEGVLAPESTPLAETKEPLAIELDDFRNLIKSDPRLPTLKTPDELADFVVESLVTLLPKKGETPGKSLLIEFGMPKDDVMALSETEVLGELRAIEGNPERWRIVPGTYKANQLKYLLEQAQNKPVAPPAPKPPIDPTPSGQALGIVPPGSGKLMEIIDKAIGKPKEAGPAIKTETDTALPDFQEHGASKKIFSQPFGFENLPIIGALFGGTRRLAGHVNESLSTYWAERQIGRSIASAFGSEHSWLDKPFTIKDGQITNITPAREGASRYISDVFEALQKDPTSYVLNAEQQRAFDAVQKLEKDFSRLEEKYKIGKEVDDESGNPAESLDDVDAPSKKGPYFPRIVTARPEGVTSGLTRGSNVGSKAFFEKPRLFESEAEGWSKGYKYEPSIVNRLATRTERLYKRIADKRLSSDPTLEGVGRKEVEAQLKASFAEELTDGSMSEKKIGQMADSVEARGRVYAPAFFNKIFPEATANQLNKAFPQSQKGLRHAAASINNATKGLQLGLDMGVGFIQGQALLARHPAIWAKAQFNSLSAMFRKEQFPNYVRDNLEPVRELAQLGSGVGRLEEYMAGLGGKELLGKVPGVKAFGRQFQTFLDVAKVEMWKAYRETTPREQWSDVVQTIESVLSSGRMEGVGVSQGRALSERALLLAPSYYRGGLNMIAAMAEKGASGQIARKAMTAYATGGAVLFYGVAKALGMSDEDILQRMNPARSDFMLWRIKTKNHISNVGFGGFYRSLLRLMGNTAKTSMEHPENWASLSPAKNPITKWYRGHAGPVVTATWDGFSGKDYMGEDTDIASIARRAITPITLQSAKGRPGQPTPTLAESAGSFVGLQSFPATSKSELNKLHSEWLANNKDPKVKADYERNVGKPREQSKYSKLVTGLIDKDQKAIAGAIKALRADGLKRSDIYKRFSPYTVSGEAQKPLFHESASMEAKFKKSLTPEQKKLYDEARADRKEQWKLFLKAYRKEK